MQQGTQDLVPSSTVTPRSGSWGFRPGNWPVTYLTRQKILPEKSMPFTNMALLIDHLRFGITKLNHPTSLIHKWAYWEWENQISSTHVSWLSPGISGPTECSFSNRNMKAALYWPLHAFLTSQAMAPTWSFLLTLTAGKPWMNTSLWDSLPGSSYSIWSALTGKLHPWSWWESALLIMWSFEKDHPGHQITLGSSTHLAQLKLGVPNPTAPTSDCWEYQANCTQKVEARLYFLGL